MRGCIVEEGNLSIRRRPLNPLRRPPRFKDYRKVTMVSRGVVVVVVVVILDGSVG